MQEDGHATKYGNHQKCDDLHFLYFLVDDVRQNDLYCGSNNQRTCSRVDVVHLVKRKENNKRNEIKDLLHVALTIQLVELQTV